MSHNFEYDLNKFGNQLYELRKKNKLTQGNIRDLCGLNPDTIRKIESGYTVPTIDTLTKLTEIYNVETDKILDNCKYQNNEILTAIKKEIDLASYSDDVCNIKNLIEKLQSSYIDQNYQLSMKLLIEQLEILAEIIEIKNKTDIASVLHSSDLCYKALKLTKKDLSIKKLSLNLFTPIETRFLIALAFAKSRMNDTETAVSICQTVIENLRIHCKYKSDYYPILIQSYYALSHFFYLLDKNIDVISTCDIALELSRDQFNMKFLPHIYYRKGIAEFMIELPNYKNSLRLSMCFFEALCLTELKEKYISVLGKKYGISYTDLF